eukprot:g14412.t1
MEMYLRQELRYTAQGRSSTSNQGGCLPVNVQLTALNQNGDEEDCFSDFKYAVHKKGGSIEKYGLDSTAAVGGTNNKYGAAGFRPKFSVRVPGTGSVAREQNWRTSINNLPLIRINHYLDLNLDLAGYGCETAAMSIPVTIVAPMDPTDPETLKAGMAMVDTNEPFEKTDSDSEDGGENAKPQIMDEKGVKKMLEDGWVADMVYIQELDQLAAGGGGAASTNPNAPQHHPFSPVQPTTAGAVAVLPVAVATKKSGPPPASDLSLADRARQSQAKEKQVSTLRGVQAAQNEALTEAELSVLTEFEQKKEKFRTSFAAILNTQKFDLVIGFIILLNSISIGYEAQLTLEGKSTAAFAVLEHLFLIIYCVELGSRFFCFGFVRSLLDSGWVSFDFTLVCVGMLSQWMLPLFFSSTPSALEPVLVLRVLRLLRLARAVRLIVTFKTLWMLVRGLLTSADTIMFTFVLIAMTVYLFAVLGVELITKNKSVFIHGDDGTFAPEGHMRGLMETEFHNLPSIMLTLLSFVTLDSVSTIYAPMIKFQPLLFFYFIPFILIVSVAMMNLVTAVLVENALESSKNDKEVNAVHASQKLTAMMPEIKKIFLLLDKDGSGEITKEEIVDGLKEHPEIALELEHFLGRMSPLELFDSLDVDGDGSIGIDEFCDALLERVTTQAPIELTRVLKVAKQTKSDVQKLLNAQRMNLVRGGGGGGGGGLLGAVAGMGGGAEGGGAPKAAGAGPGMAGLMAGGTPKPKAAGTVPEAGSGGTPEQLQKKVEGRLETLEKKVDAMQKKVDARMDRLERTLEQMTEMLGKISHSVVVEEDGWGEVLRSCLPLCVVAGGGSVSEGPRVVLALGQHGGQKMKMNQGLLHQQVSRGLRSGGLSSPRAVSGDSGFLALSRQGEGRTRIGLRSGSREEGEEEASEEDGADAKGHKNKGSPGKNEEDPGASESKKLGEDAEKAAAESKQPRKQHQRHSTEGQEDHHYQEKLKDARCFPYTRPWVGEGVDLGTTQSLQDALRELEPAAPIVKSRDLDFVGAKSLCSALDDQAGCRFEPAAKCSWDAEESKCEVLDSTDVVVAAEKKCGKEHTEEKCVTLYAPGAHCEWQDGKCVAGSGPICEDVSEEECKAWRDEEERCKQRSASKVEEEECENSICKWDAKEGTCRRRRWTSGFHGTDRGFASFHPLGSSEEPSGSEASNASSTATTTTTKHELTRTESFIKDIEEACSKHNGDFEKCRLENAPESYCTWDGLNCQADLFRYDANLGCAALSGKSQSECELIPIHSRIVPTGAGEKFSWPEDDFWPSTMMLRLNSTGEDESVPSGCKWEKETKHCRLMRCSDLADTEEACSKAYDPYFVGGGSFVAGPKLCTWDAEAKKCGLSWGGEVVPYGEAVCGHGENAHCELTPTSCYQIFDADVCGASIDPETWRFCEWRGLHGSWPAEYFENGEVAKYPVEWPLCVDRAPVPEHVTRSMHGYSFQEKPDVAVKALQLPFESRGVRTSSGSGGADLDVTKLHKNLGPVVKDRPVVGLDEASAHFAARGDWFLAVPAEVFAAVEVVATSGPSPSATTLSTHEESDHGHRAARREQVIAVCRSLRSRGKIKRCVLLEVGGGASNLSRVPQPDEVFPMRAEGKGNAFALFEPPAVRTTGEGSGSASPSQPSRLQQCVAFLEELQTKESAGQLHQTREQKMVSTTSAYYTPGPRVGTVEPPPSVYHPRYWAYRAARFIGDQADYAQELDPAKLFALLQALVLLILFLAPVWQTQGQGMRDDGKTSC